MKKIIPSVFNRVIAGVIFLIFHLSVLAQDVADSDLSNRAGTNKNFRDQWWLFGVIALVVLIIIVAYTRRRRR
ncbi:MAG TPA: hypothetical protein VGE26_03555 [Sphingobacteriaceae bacterium]